MYSPSRCLRIFLTAALCCALSACMMYSTVRPYPYVSKLELTLNVNRIPDDEVRGRAQDAQPTIMRTLQALVNGKLDREEVERQLNWSVFEPLLLPPESHRDQEYLERFSLKRRPFSISRAKEWASPDPSTLTLVVTFTDAIRPSIVVRERQTYRRTSSKWALARQERVD